MNMNEQFTVTVKISGPSLMDFFACSVLSLFFMSTLATVATVSYMSVFAKIQ